MGVGFPLTVTTPITPNSKMADGITEGTNTVYIEGSRVTVTPLIQVSSIQYSKLTL